MKLGEKLAAIFMEIHMQGRYHLSVALLLTLLQSCDQKESTPQQSFTESRQRQETAVAPKNHEMEISEGPPKLPDPGRKSFIDSKSLPSTGFEFAEGRGSLENGMHFFSTVPVFEDFGLALSRFAVRLANEDPRTGLEWLLQQNPNSSTAYAISRFSQTLHGQDPNLTNDLLKTISNDVAKESFYEGIIRQLASVSTEDAAHYIEETFHQHPSLLVKAAATLIASIPDQHLDILGLAAKYPESISAETYGGSLFEVWKNDRHAAEEKLATLAKPPFPERIWDSFMTKFVRFDYVAASEWAVGLPRSKTRDTVSFTIAREISNNFPVDALRWGIGIGDAYSRGLAIEMTFDSARRYDPDGAASAILDSNLSDDERNRLLDRITTKR